MYWYGSEPRLCLTDAAQIKEFLSSKYAANATGKSWLQRQGTRHFIGRGLLMANGAHWSHQRHVVAPAFMPDKLKVRRRRRHLHSFPLFSFVSVVCVCSVSFFLEWSWWPRKLTSPGVVLQGRVGHMVECTKQTIRALQEAASSPAPSPGGGRCREVEIGGYMTRLTGDIISRTEFDTSYDTGKLIFRLLEDLQRLTASSSRHLWIPGSQ